MTPKVLKYMVRKQVGKPMLLIEYWEERDTIIEQWTDWPVVVSVHETTLWDSTFDVFRGLTGSHEGITLITRRTI